MHFPTNLEYQQDNLRAANNDSDYTALLKQSSVRYETWKLTASFGNDITCHQSYHRSRHVVMTTHLRYVIVMASIRLHINQTWFWRRGAGGTGHVLRHGRQYTDICTTDKSHRHHDHSRLYSHTAYVTVAHHPPAFTFCSRHTLIISLSVLTAISPGGPGLSPTPKWPIIAVSNGTLNSTIPYNTWVSRYQNVFILDFIGAQDDEGGGYNWSYKFVCLLGV